MKILKIIIIGILLLSSSALIVKAGTDEIDKTNEQTNIEIEEPTIKEGGKIQITKTVAEDNKKYNIKKGQAIANVYYEIQKEETGEVVDVMKTNEKGIAISKTLPCGYYVVIEIQTVEEFLLDNMSYGICIEEDNQIVKITSSSRVDEWYLDEKQEKKQTNESEIEQKQTTIKQKLPRTGY